MKTIVLSPPAAKSLDKMQPDTRTRLSEELAAYALGKPCDTRAMQGTSTVRMRVGDYRVIFDELPETILVLVIGHRREIYR